MAFHQALSSLQDGIQQTQCLQGQNNSKSESILSHAIKALQIHGELQSGGAVRV